MSTPIQFPEQFFGQLNPPALQETARQVHAFMHTYAGVQCRMTYGIPFYYARKRFAYLNADREGRLELAFTHAYLLPNRKGIIDLRGRKQVGGLYLPLDGELPWEEMDEIIQEALTLDASWKK